MKHRTSILFSFLKRYMLFFLTVCLFFYSNISAQSLFGSGIVPDEPIEIGHEPQFFTDNYIIDNHWAFQQEEESIRRIFHQPVKYEGNPVLPDFGGSYFSVVKDEDGVFHLWYKDVRTVEDMRVISYATSRNGINWDLPNLGHYQNKDSEDTNVVWMGVDGQDATGPCLVSVPEEKRGEYKYILSYRARRGENEGLNVIGLNDPTEWKAENNRLITSGYHPDTQTSIVYDPVREEYVMFTRNTHIYSGNPHKGVDGGATRHVSRLASPELWTDWDVSPQTIILPENEDIDELFMYSYGMPTTYYAGIYWGMRWAFKRNTDIYTELVTSRDGYNFRRFSYRPRLIDLGDEGMWDSGMVMASAQWVEVGDEWWIYYRGDDGAHGSRDRIRGVGVAKVRKEGFASLRGPEGGGVVVSRTIRWPGGNLILNADPTGGELKVRISDPNRRVVEGFDYDDFIPFTDNNIAHEAGWKNASMDDLEGEVIRIEFYLRNADIYTFRAGE